MKQFYHQVHAGQACNEISPGFFRSPNPKVGFPSQLIGIVFNDFILCQFVCGCFHLPYFEVRNRFLQYHALRKFKRWILSFYSIR
jgi:hypothetical protein